ncbi:ComEA family DNA-binding protein [Thermosipho ferrireducens]|uniref:ComEA family DNA-binding protein n=1 Tax=Thermosipho ferrireducens TaxID=2571116 RepID=UPI001D194C20|nr:ComEA family DNA-binding protein [Thermosipho ferrireducens]
MFSGVLLEPNKLKSSEVTYKPRKYVNQIIDLNTASIDEIKTLHGIGPAKAQAIVDYRKKFGPFKSIKDVLNVPGIGTATLEKIKDRIYINDSAEINTNNASKEHVKININTATEQELETLPGIGKVKAKAIVNYRTENGNYTTYEDLLNVSGIGKVTLEKIKPYIEF